MARMLNGKSSRLLEEIIKVDRSDIISQQEFADRLGCDRVTVYRQMQCLCKDGLIFVLKEGCKNQRKYLVDLDKVQTLENCTFYAQKLKNMAARYINPSIKDNRKEKESKVNKNYNSSSKLSYKVNIIYQEAGFSKETVQMLQKLSKRLDGSGRGQFQVDGRWRSIQHIKKLLGH